MYFSHFWSLLYCFLFKRKVLYFESIYLIMKIFYCFPESQYLLGENTYWIIFIGYFF